MSINGAGRAALIRRSSARPSYGSAATFEQARAAFEAALNRLLPKLTAADFEEYRRDRAFHAWKYAMKDAGCTMPTATADGRSRCFCGAEIDIEGRPYVS
jgi:hypothetical protein